MWIALISLIAGAVLPFAFAPFNLYTLAFLSPAVLLWIWLRSTPWQACYRGFLFGFGFFGVGTSWVYISIHNFGNASVFLASFITALLIAFLALYFALQGYLSRQLFQHKSITIQSLCVFPAMWLILEVLRAFLFTGFPWLSLGYSQFSTPLHSLTPLFGVFGLSLATCFISGALVVLATRMEKMTPKILAIVIIVVLMVAGWSLNGRLWTQPTGKAISTSLVQGDIAQEIKWKPEQLMNILNVYKNITSTLWNSKLIVWPEAAIPTYPEDVEAYYQYMNKLAKQNDSYLIIGSPLYDPATKQFYNGLQMIGAGHGVYYKRHLVPFGEYIPLKSVFGPLIKKLHIPMSDFSKGPAKQKPLQVGPIKIASFICYEIAFSREVLRYIIGTQLIINISDDSWFGHSIALNQQLQMAQFRALETGRPVLSSTNTGVTAIINSLGKIVAVLPIDQPRSLTGKVMPMKGETPLMRWDYYPILVIVVLLLLISVVSRNSISSK